MKIIPSIEPILQYWRIFIIKKDLVKGSVAVDIGCGDPPILINLLKHKFINWIGLDIDLKSRNYENITLKKQNINNNLELKDDFTDLATMLAVLEHVDYPQKIINDIYRVLKKNGQLLITVPSPKSEKVLNITAKLGLVRQEMIDQHKNYFNHKQLKSILNKAGFKNIFIKDFQFGFNTYVRAIK